MVPLFSPPVQQPSPAKPLRIGAPSVAALPPAYRSVKPLRIDELPVPPLPPPKITVSKPFESLVDYMDYSTYDADKAFDMAIAASLEDMKIRSASGEMDGKNGGKDTGVNVCAIGVGVNRGESSRAAYVNAIMEDIKKEAAAGKGKGKMPTTYEDIVRWDVGRPKKVDPVTSRQHRREKEAMRPTPPDQYDSDGDLVFIGIGPAERRLVDADVEMPAKGE